MADRDELSVLRAENARLIGLLEAHGIEWRAPSRPLPLPAEKSRLSADEKVALVRRLFRGRTDVRVIDTVDAGHWALLRMWERRQGGYRAMGYRIRSEDFVE